MECRDELEKRQLLHTIQLLKLELSQKQLIIDTWSNEQVSQMEDLRELLADTQHEKKLLSLRVQSMSHGYEQELKRAREKVQEERSRGQAQEMAQRDAQRGLEEVRQEVELALSSFPHILDEQQYHNLKSADSAVLSLKDFVWASW